MPFATHCAEVSVNTVKSQQTSPNWTNPDKNFIKPEQTVSQFCQARKCFSDFSSGHSQKSSSPRCVKSGQHGCALAKYEHASRACEPVSRIRLTSFQHTNGVLPCAIYTPAFCSWLCELSVRQTWFRQFNKLYFISELSVGRTLRSPNMVQSVWQTMLHFLTDLLMICELQPELHCAGYTQTCVHMLTHTTHAAYRPFAAK